MSRFQTIPHPRNIEGLKEAIKYDNLECIQLMKENGFRFDAVRSYGNLLYEAARCGNFRIFKYLYEECGMNLITDDILLVLVKYGHLKLIEYLDDKIRISDSVRCKMIKSAIEDEYTSIVKYLLSPHPGPALRCGLKLTETQIWSIRDDELFKYVIQNTDTNHLIEKMYSRGDYNHRGFLKLILDKRQTKQSVVNRLFEQASMRYGGLSLFLIENGYVNPHRANEKALIHASAIGHLKFVEYLVTKCFADTSALKCRAMKLAKKYKRTQVVKFLEQHTREKCLEILNKEIEPISQLPGDMIQLISTFI